MQEILSQLFGYLWGIWRYRWVALVAAWCIAIGGWLWVYQVPEQYQATARINVDSNTILRPLLRGLAIQPDISQRIDLMSRTLLSRPNLEKLMRMADLDLEVQNDAQKDRMLTMLKENTQLEGSRQSSSLYTVGFTHQDRDVAKRVVQSLITVFIETTLGDKREDGADAQTFLDQQIAEYEVRLVEAENRLAAFKQEHVDILPGDTGGYYQNLNRERELLKTAQLQLREMENRRSELKRQLAGEEPVFLSSGVGEIPAVSQLEGRIQSLESKLDTLLSRYTEKHPEVVQIRHIIEDLEAEKQQEIEAAMSGPAADFSGLQSSPVYQQMRSMLAESEARVAELRVRVKEYSQRVDALEAKVSNIPEIEAQLKQLDRDYTVIQQQHTNLLTRRESARISQDVEQKASDVSFRVIDPPFVPLKPNEPNKTLLNGAVFVIALGAGCGIALILSLLKPVIIDRRSLAHLTGLPILGSVMFVPTPEQRRHARKNTVQFAALSLALIIVFAGVSVGEQWLLG